MSAFNRAHLDYFSKRSTARIVSYEELRADPREKISSLLDFIGVVNYDIDHIVTESSFERMREVELSGDSQLKKKHALYGMRGNDLNSLKVRKGKVGGYIDELRPETIEKARVLCSRYGFDA